MSFPSILNARGGGKTITIKRTSRTADGYGGYTTAETILYRRVKCRFNALGSEETTLTYNKQTVFANMYCFLEYRSGIKENDRLYLEDGSNRDFIVKLIMNWDEANNYLKLAVLEETRSPA